MPTLWDSKTSVALFAGLLGLTTLFLRSGSKPHRKISKETILIIGASSGVGLETAIRYAEQRGKDITLLLVARRPLAELQQRLNALGSGEVHTYNADVSQASEVFRLFNEIKEQHAKIDTVIVW